MTICARDSLTILGRALITTNENLVLISQGRTALNGFAAYTNSPEA